MELRYWDDNLFYKYVGINLAGTALAGVAFVEGVIPMMLAADPTGISAVIIVLFVYTAIYGGYRMSSLNKELNLVKKANAIGRWAREKISSLAIKMHNKILWLVYSGNIMVSLGLIGTVIGIVLGLGVIGEEGISVDNINFVITQVIEKLHIAFYTTLIGGVAYIWNMVNLYLLRSATNLYLAEVENAQ